MTTMLTILELDSPEGKARVEKLTERAEATPPDVLAQAAEIVAAVRRRGDAAVAELTYRFEHRKPGANGFEVEGDRWKAEAQKREQLLAGCKR